MQDFAGAGIGLRHSDRPAAAIAIGPLNRGITLVQGVGTFRQVFDDQRVAETRLLKCLVPPQRPFSRGGPNRFRNCLIEVEDNWLYRITDGSGGIFLLQAPARDVHLAKRIFVAPREILKTRPEKANTRISDSRLVSGGRKREKRDV